eukprot:2935-Heterococcus_DN1.PRE.5
MLQVQQRKPPTSEIQIYLMGVSTAWPLNLQWHYHKQEPPIYTHEHARRHLCEASLTLPLFRHGALSNMHHLHSLDATGAARLTLLLGCTVHSGVLHTVQHN